MLAAGVVTEPEGRVTASSGLALRGLPTMSSGRVGTLERGEHFPIVCKVTGSVVRRGDSDVSNLWYRVPGSRPQWVSALYTRIVNHAPAYCGDGETHRGRTATSTLVRREAPTTRANAPGALGRGDTMRILCKLHAQDVGGNNLWYNLPRGLWVAARYVDNVGSVPASCTT